MIFLKKTSLFLFVGVLSACGGGAGTPDISSSVKTYDGNWVESPACDDVSYTDPNSGGIVNESILASVNIAGGAAVLNVTEYSGSNDCTGTSKNYIGNMSLTYGADVPTASSICSNTKKVDVIVTSMSVDGVSLSAVALAAAIAADQVPSLNNFGLICTSPDGTRLYFGDDESGTKLGDSDSTRPTQIDSATFLVKQ